MTRKPESKGFLGKAGFEKNRPSRKVGFFCEEGNRIVDDQILNKKGAHPGIEEILSKHFSHILRCLISIDSIRCLRNPKTSTVKYSWVHGRRLPTAEFGRFSHSLIITGRYRLFFDLVLFGLAGIK